jgi:diguanylate cyclase (GGDEF)-like protein/putative nucleotidyltransferase with HDIG domain
VAINQILFVAIPTVALLLNLYLLLICISAKKNRLIYAFMWLVLAFSAWTGGSAAMRAMLFPGVRFWYDVSMIGIFATPFLLYNFIHHYTNHKGGFTLLVLGLSWLLLILLQLSDVFIQLPEVTAQGDSRTFSYTMTLWVVLPLVVGVVTLALAGRRIHLSVKRQGMPTSSMRPLYLGAAFMFAGLLTTAIPGMGSFPIDPLACGINALLLFYALHRKRMITFKMVTSRGPVYLAAAILTTLLLAIVYPSLDRLYLRLFSEYADQQTIVIAVLVSLLTVLVYNLLRSLLQTFFARGQMARDEELRRFSREINESLDSQLIFKTFGQFIEKNIDCDAAYVCVREESGDFVTRAHSKPAVSGDVVIPHASPLISWLWEHKTAVSFKDFSRTQHYRAMWDTEKEMLRALSVRLILPITQGGRLIAVTLFSDHDSQKIGSPGDIIFLESAAAIMSIAANNAMLYSVMQNEAQMDGLTGLHNRRHFLEKIKEDFEKARKSSFTVCIISLDDFRLYNELYGSFHGDKLLQDFAKILLAVTGNQGRVGRYSGKEFILAIPFKDAGAVSDNIDIIRDMLGDYLRSSKEEGHRFLTFSAGICSFPTAASSLDEAIHYASIAVYAAKKNGKNRTQLYREGQSFIDITPEALHFGEQCAQTIYALTAAIDAKDHYTFRHSENVSKYASRLAEEIGLDQEHVEIIRQAGLLHDIGKIGIPESILVKDGPLTQEEYKAMQRHVEGSIAMIKYLPSLDYVTPAAIGHHERWDGKGYPRGLKGEDIPIAARCLCVADAFDAMTTARSYKPSLSVAHALDEIRRNLGTQFDPKIGLVFVKAVEEGRIILQNK